MINVIFIAPLVMIIDLIVTMRHLYKEYKGDSKKDD